MIDLTVGEINSVWREQIGYKSRQNGPQLFILFLVGFGSNEQIHENDILPNFSPVHTMLVAARKTMQYKPFLFLID